MREIPHLHNPVNKRHSLCPQSQPLQSRETLKYTQIGTILVTLHLNWEKATVKIWKRLVSDCSYEHVRPCGGLANRGVAVNRPSCWEDHMPLSTPAGCVGGGLASPRIGPESLSPESHAGPNEARESLENDKWKKANCIYLVIFTCTQTTNTTVKTTSSTAADLSIHQPEVRISTKRQTGCCRVFWIHSDTRKLASVTRHSLSLRVSLISVPLLF